jgi:hypothetical protein
MYNKFFITEKQSNEETEKAKLLRFSSRGQPALQKHCIAVSLDGISF